MAKKIMYAVQAKAIEDVITEALKNEASGSIVPLGNVGYTDGKSITLGMEDYFFGPEFTKHDWVAVFKALLAHEEQHINSSTVLEGGKPYEITTYRTEGPYSDSRRPDYVEFVSRLEADLARRDLTMNAIAMGLDGSLRDPFGGAGDIKAGLIRCVGEPAQRFQEDGLRVMRTLRFASCFGFSIEEKTSKAIHENRAMLGRVAAERINTELCKLLMGPGAVDMLRNYSDIFCQFWPQLESLIHMEQNNPWHCYNGWEHTLHTMDAVSEDLVLRLSSLLHDIGKPSCKTTGENGVDHFYGHPAAGAKMADEMLRQLRFDTRTRERVVQLVKLHDVEIPLREKSVRKWLGKLGPEVFFQLLEVKVGKK